MLPKKILIVKPSSLGDIVHSLPFLNVMKSCFAKAEIDWVVAKGLEGILQGHPMIDELIIIDKDKWKKPLNGLKTLHELKKLTRQLRQKEYDLVVDLQGLLRSGIISMATRAPVRIGFSEAREGGTLFYTTKIGAGKNIHAVDRYLQIAESLGCSTEHVIFPFPFDAEGVAKMSSLKEKLGEYVVIVPGARWKTKIWPAERFGLLASMLPLRSVVVGSGLDSGIGEEIARLSKGKAISLAGGTSISELIGIMRGAKIVVSNDSGPMHIAAAFTVPVVAIFGPTSPLRTGPYGKGHVVIKSRIPCSPCFKRSCKTIQCMREISVTDVFSAVEKGLSAG